MQFFFTAPYLYVADADITRARGRTKALARHDAVFHLSRPALCCVLTLHFRSENIRIRIHIHMRGSVMKLERQPSI